MMKIEDAVVIATTLVGTLLLAGMLMLTGAVALNLVLHVAKRKERDEVRH